MISLTFRQAVRLVGFEVIASAGIVLVHCNPLYVAKIFELSRASYRKMIQNL